MELICNEKSRSVVMAKLYKKAIGYTVKEVVEEYSGEESGGELLKRKITSKPIPPDISAMKTYFDMLNVIGNIETMSDEELEVERVRLIGLIAECDVGNNIPKPHKRGRAVRQSADNTKGNLDKKPLKIDTKSELHTKEIDSNEIDETECEC